MRLILEENFEAIPNVDAGRMDEVLATDSFGKFAILLDSENAFMQMGNQWEPGESCKTFLREHKSDPWVLQYRERSQQFQAEGLITLDGAREAFLSYLAGTAAWRQRSGGGYWSCERGASDVNVIHGPATPGQMLAGRWLHDVVRMSWSAHGIR